MLNTLRKSTVFLLFLVLPLQGLAASLSHVLCAAPVMSDTAHGGHDHGSGDTDHGHGPEGTDDDAGYAGHLACHQILSGIPSFAVAAQPDFAGSFSPSDPHSPPPFFPEQPQPVPLA